MAVPEMTLEERVELLEARLRHVLATLAVSPIEYTTISDSQGSFQGHDCFIGIGLRTEAETLLDQWDEEDGFGPAEEEVA